ncbi:small nucleolar ribonucleoprotein complex component (Utp5) [Purpureocillium lavendulum]|uniref:EKC/KEOPS complex subunit GON7 n=1 Tax=Purpureocillium lavendulum TaxID=1247861 RepID=A0AB34FMT1_9HYPO|nr:small nucleolar ribonucleoprotein complex component (Utp5) [Purpureocillium lavendulum]
MSQPKIMYLTATYTSPANEGFAVSKSIAAPATSSDGASAADNAAAVDEKSRYLEALRAAVAETQDRVNKELTARMEEDKARDAAAGAGNKLAVDEDKEEENYGEEVQEEED